MIRTWSMLGLSSILTVALTAPIDAGDTADKGKTIEERLKAIDDTLKTNFANVGTDVSQIRKDISEIKTEAASAKLKFELLEQSVKNLQAQVDILKKRLPYSDVALYPPTDKSTIDDIQRRLTDIQQALTKLQPSTRVAMSAPTGGTGRVVLVNAYTDDMTFYVNGQPYAVGPGARAVLDNVPAGTLTYQAVSDIWGWRGGRTTSLAPNETLTLTASR